MRNNRIHLFSLTLVISFVTSHPVFAAMGLDEMMTKLVGNMQGPLIDLVTILCYVIGTIYIFRGLLKMVKLVDQGSRGQSMSGLLGTLLVGAFLTNLPATLSIVSESMFQNAGDAQLCNTSSTFSACTGGVLAYADSTAGIDAAAKKKALATFNAIMVVIQLVGLIGFVKGLTILRAASDGNTQVTSMAGITHIIGGAIAWNIVTFITFIGATLQLPV